MTKKIPDSHLLALGSLSVEFGILEASVVRTISDLLTFDVNNFESILLLVGGDSFETLLTKLKKIFIYKLLDGKLLKKFDTLYNKLDSIREERNRYLHSYWTANDKEGIVRVKFRRIPDKNNILTDRIKFDTKQLSNFIEKIKTAEYELQNLIEEATQSIIFNKVVQDAKENN